MTISPAFDLEIYPTDSLGRDIRPIVYFNRTLLPTDSYHNTFNQLGQLITRDDENRPVGPDGRPLRKNDDGHFVYPLIDAYGQPKPTDPTNFKPVHTVVDADGNLYERDAAGRAIDANGVPVPTDESGRPVGLDASPLPTDTAGRFKIGLSGNGGGTTEADSSVKVLPTDQMGFEVYPIVDGNGNLLPTASTGNHVNLDGEEVVFPMF